MRYTSRLALSRLTLSLAAVLGSAGMLSAQLGGAGGGSSGAGGAFNSSAGAFGGSSGLGGGLGGGGSALMNASAMAGGFMQFGLGVTNGFGNSGNAQPSTFGARAVSNPTGTGSSPGGGGMNRQNSSTGNRNGGNGGTAGRGGNGGRGATGGRTAASGAGGRNRGGSSSRNAAEAQPQYWSEPRVQIGFPVAGPQSSVVTAHVARSLATANVTSPFRFVEVSVNGQTAYLRGTVSSVADRDLAEQIALLEPAISSVKNELNVRAPLIAPRPPARQP